MPGFPSFGDIAKPATDLFDFDENTELVVTRKTASGVSVKTTTTSADALSCKIKTTIKDKDFGKLVVTAGSDGAFKTTATLTQLTADAEVTLEHVFKKKKHSGSLAVSTDQEMFAAEAKVSGIGAAKQSLEVSAVGGADGIVGGVCFNAALSGTPALTDYNLGVRYTQDDVFGAVTTEEKCLKQSAFIAHQCCASTQWFARVNHADSKFTFGAGAEHSLDKETTVKAAVNDAKKLNLSITHVLSDPKLSLTLAGVCNLGAKTPFATTALALSMSLGDF